MATNEKRLKTVAGHLADTKIADLIKQKDTGQGKAALARLRQAAGKSPEEFPEIWGIVLTDIPEPKASDSSITPAENAVFTALTLYAIAAKGDNGRGGSAQVPDISLGAAFGKIAGKDENRLDAMLSKIKSILQSDSITEIGLKLRPQIGYLTEETGLDFAMLADDLYRCNFPDSRKRVHLKWARDFNNEVNRINEEGEKNDEE